MEILQRLRDSLEGLPEFLKGLRGPLQGLQPQMVLVFVSLMAVVLVIALSFINATNRNIAESRLSKDLEIGERIFGRVLAQNSEQLVQGAKVLAADFGFREAIATNDVPTIQSALRNYGDRIKADLVMLFDLNNELVVSTPQIQHSGRAAEFAGLIAQADRNGSATTIQVVDERLYQLVVVPVKAPITIAWVAMGFTINDKVAADLQALSGLQVSFASRTNRPLYWELYASTFPGTQRAQLLKMLGNEPPLPERVTLGEDEWESRVVKIGEHGDTHEYAILQRSLTAAMAPFRQLQRTLLGLGFVSVLLCLLGSIFIARSIVKPMRLLVDATTAIRDGNYEYPVQTGQKGEIGDLAESFSLMQRAIGEREAQILKLAYEDSLTGLPNRQLFNDRLNQALRHAKRSKQGLCVVLMDIDRFKFVNDTLGHKLGDVLLEEVGRRLRVVLRQSDTVARMGGDEFALLLPESAIDSLPMLEKIQEVLREPVMLEGQPVDINVSMGVSAYPEHGGDSQTLIRSADVAMYVAKRANSNYAIFDPSYDQFRQEHLSLLGELQRAIELNQLTLYYQPKQHLASNEIRQAEALVRWIHPERGFIPPMDFIPFAEQTGYIKAVSHWVIGEAIRQLGEWKTQGVQLAISINLSTRDLRDDNLPAYVQECISAAGVAPAQICLEITESGFMEEPEQALAILRRLHDLGLSLSIDDYGTGYSSLAYVKKLPVNELKIDRAFIMNMTRNKGDEMIVRSTIDLGHNLGLSVVAEGIDDADTLEMLRQLGCDYAQGFLIAKPMPGSDFVAWLAAHKI